MFDLALPCGPRSRLRRNHADRRIFAIRLRSLTLATAADRLMPRRSNGRTRSVSVAVAEGTSLLGPYGSPQPAPADRAMPVSARLTARLVGRGGQGSSAAPSGGADDPRYVTMRFAHTIGTGQPTIPESGDSRSAGSLRRSWSADGNGSHHVFVVLQSHTYGVLEWIGSDRRPAAPRSSSRNVRRQLFPAAFGFASRGKKAVADRLPLRSSLSGAG